MNIKSVHIKNFRAIQNELLYFDKLTALIGPNGSGKSSFLYALDSFFNNTTIKESDFYNNDTNQEITITITFENISENIKTEFKKYIKNNELKIEKVIIIKDNKIEQNYHGLSWQIEEFYKIKNASNKNETMQKYDVIKLKYPNLEQNCKSKKGVLDALDKYEEDNMDACTLVRDDAKMFEYTTVGISYINDHIQFIHIPAVHDAEKEATESTRSRLSQLVDIAVRNKLEQNEEFKELKEEFQSQIIDNIKNNNQLSELSNALTVRMNEFAMNSKIDISFEDMNFKISLPSVIVNMVEDGYKSLVKNTGHGLQRIFIMTILQAIYKHEESDKKDIKESTTLVLGIDEPELYQHPNRQRHMYKILCQLTNEQNLTYNLQMVYNTHSSHFVGINIINQIRIIRKIQHDNTRSTKIINVKLGELVDKLNKINKSDFSVDNVIARLHSIETHWIKEGFFSKGVVLVEGDSDRAAIIETAKLSDIDFDDQDVSIIPCHTKNDLGKALTIFRELKIPAYVIWDNDHKIAKPESSKEDIKKIIDNNCNASKFNKMLLKLLGASEEDFPVHVADNYACFNNNLETMFEESVGEQFEKLKKNVSSENIGVKKIFKNPVTISQFFNKLDEQDIAVPIMLKNIIDKINNLTS